jgi:hypothetical protein
MPEQIVEDEAYTQGEMLALMGFNQLLMDVTGAARSHAYWEEQLNLTKVKNNPEKLAEAKAKVEEMLKRWNAAEDVLQKAFLAAWSAK